MWNRLQTRLFEPIDAASLVAFRVFFGVMASISALRFFYYDWIDRFFYERDVFFQFVGFEWLHPLPRPGMHLLFGALALLGLCIAAGLFYRLSTTLFVLGLTYVGLVDTTNYLNHYWFVRFVGFLMIFMPLGEFGSLDAWRRSSGSTTSRISAWSLWTLRGQAAVLYLSAGAAKLQWDWLMRGQPMEIWLSARTYMPVIGPWLALDWVPQAMSIAGAIFDLTIVFLLLDRRTRLWGYLAVVGFHGMTAWLFNIGMFPLIMIGLTTIFFEPDWPRRLAPRLVEAIGLPEPEYDERVPPNASRASDVVPTLNRRRAIAVGLGLWFVLQTALPLRHLAYPGDVNWTREGFQFAWRVKLVESSGFLKFRVRDADSDQTWVVHPNRYLDRRQIEVASVDPAKILQLAHHIAEDFRARGHGDVEVRADARVAMNGHPSKRLSDPDVDLADQPRTWGHADWILHCNPPARRTKGNGSGGRTGPHRPPWQSPLIESLSCRRHESASSPRHIGRAPRGLSRGESRLRRATGK